MCFILCISTCLFFISISLYSSCSWLNEDAPVSSPRPDRSPCSTRANQKDRLGIPIVRDRFPSKTFSCIVNNNEPLRPYLRVDPVMKKLGHDRWNSGTVLFSEKEDRFLPEPWGRDHISFQQQILPRIEKCSMGTIDTDFKGCAKLFSSNQEEEL